MTGRCSLLYLHNLNINRQNRQYNETKQNEKNTCFFMYLLCISYSGVFYNFIYYIKQFIKLNVNHLCYSQSHTIKVPISWKALIKLVHWLYSGELPLPVSGCLWDNLDSDEKLHEMATYLELCWLAEFWLLEDLQEKCSRIVISCLDSSRYLSIKILRLAASLNQGKLTEVSAEYVAPLYHRLRTSGELEALDEELVDMVRAASVRLSQKDSD